ncbi:MAG: SigB/SigF/SigG family RNA polymerase sigma factor [Acidimicrobiales bacterium]
MSHADDATRTVTLRAKFEAYAAGNRELRDDLIEAHLWLADRLARHFANRGEPLDDLYQVSSLALIKAVDRFDPERGVEFTSYATTTIIGELKRHFRDRGWSVRAPRRIQELYLHLGQAISDLSQSLGRSPTIQELAQVTSASEEDVLEALEAGHAYRATSLDAPSDDDDTLGSHLGGEDEEFTNSERRLLLEPYLQRLPSRERLILKLRFEDDLTQSEIAQQLGISQMHVSRLLSKCLARLHEAYQAADS